MRGLSRLGLVGLTGNIMTSIFNLRKFLAAKNAPSGNDDRKVSHPTARQSFELWEEWAATSDPAEAFNYEASSAHFRCIITSLLLN